MIFLFTSDQYEMLYIYFFFSLQPPQKYFLNMFQWNAYDKKEM